MVDVSQNEPTSAQDETALQIFQNQWEIYRKFLTYDYLSNARACASLHQYLAGDLARPYRFLDLACGDASGIVKALAGTAIEHYRGVDLSEPALALAKRNLEVLPCTVELDAADFTTALRDPQRPADIVWISLSLHHLDTSAKLAFMREVRKNIDPHGAFLIYEPTLRGDEGRPAYLDRFEAIGRRDWTRLTADEFAEAMKHVRTCDLPETAADWAKLGREAGFSSSAELYRSPDDLFRLFLYRP